MKRKSFDPQAVTAWKASRAEELALRLLEVPALDVDESTGEAKDSPSRYFAALLAMEADPENHVVTSLRKNGETYEHGVPLAKPSLRISPAYSEALRRRAHHVAEGGVRRAVEALPANERYGHKKRFNWSYRWVHLTFTMAHAPGCETEPEVERFNAAWTLFRKRDCWTKCVFAAIKGVEDRLTWRGSHVHGHVLALMRTVDLMRWVGAWRESLGGGADDPVGSIEMRTVRARPSDAGAEETMDEALAEVTKYITKTADLLDPDPETGRRVSAEVLVNLCKVERWPRMFELMGAAREAKPDGQSPAGLSSIRREYSTPGPERTEPWDPELDGPEPGRWEYFEREILESPPRGPTWRELMGRMDLKEWVEVVALRVVRARVWRLKQLQARAMGPIVDLLGVQRAWGQAHAAPGPETEARRVDSESTWYQATS